MQHAERRVATQADLGEQAHAELLAEFIDQQIGRHIEHDVGARQPGGLDRGQPHLSLNRGQIGGEQGITQTAGQPDQHSNQPIADADPGLVMGHGRRAGQRRLFMFGPVRRAAQQDDGPLRNGWRS